MISRSLATGCAAGLMALAACTVPCAAAPLPDAVIQKSGGSIEPLVAELESRANR